MMANSRPPSPGTILLVDDSELACEAVRHTLSTIGLSVVVLSSPFGFIKAIRDNSPALILVDVGLGTMNGTRLVKLGRQHAPEHCRIVLYSGREESLLAQDIAECGADGYISKGMTGSELVAQVRRWMSGLIQPHRQR